MQACCKEAYGPLRSSPSLHSSTRLGQKLGDAVYVQQSEEVQCPMDAVGSEQPLALLWVCENILGTGPLCLREPLPVDWLTLIRQHQSEQTLTVGKT